MFVPISKIPITYLSIYLSICYFYLKDTSSTFCPPERKPICTPTLIIRHLRATKMVNSPKHEAKKHQLTVRFFPLLFDNPTVPPFQFGPIA